MMRPSEVVARGTAYLRRHGVEDARSSAELLMMHVIGIDRAAIYTRTEGLTVREARSYGRALCRRCAGVPVQHVVGSQRFRGLDLRVRRGVFIPRPETELVVETALARLEETGGWLVADIGTGTGAIALAIRHERPDTDVFATDVSGEACALATENAERLGLGIDVRCGPFFDPLPPDRAGTFHLVVSNPPYVTEDEYRDLPDVVKADPAEALLGGIEVYTELAAGAAAWLRPGGALVVEIGADQGGEVGRILRGRFDDIRVEQDLAGRDRVVSGRLR
jgi:release factor glutamine methyltransferase